MIDVDKDNYFDGRYKKEVGFEMKEESKISKPLVPFNSREYEDRISKLKKDEYKLFKMIILNERIIDKSDFNLRNLYKKLEVNSRIELMARYSRNYYNEFSNDFEKNKEEKK